MITRIISETICNILFFYIQNSCSLILDIHLVKESVLFLIKKKKKDRSIQGYTINLYPRIEAKKEGEYFYNKTTDPQRVHVIYVEPIDEFISNEYRDYIMHYN